MLDRRCHSNHVVTRFLAARAHVDQVITELLVEELGEEIDALDPPADRVPTQRHVPAAGAAPAGNGVVTTQAVSASIAEAIAALDLAFDLWLGHTVGSPKPGLSI